MCGKHKSVYDPNNKPKLMIKKNLAERIKGKKETERENRKEKRLSTPRQKRNEYLTISLFLPNAMEKQ